MNFPGIFRHDHRPRPMDAARQKLAEVVTQLRHGTRPSLVGQLPDLTPTMEAAFRSGQYEVLSGQVDKQEIYHLFKIEGGSTFREVPWTKIGLTKSPAREEQRAALATYEAWQKREVDLGGGEVEPALQELARHYPGLDLQHSTSAGEVHYVQAVLDLIPASLVGPNNLTFIDLKGSRTGAARYVEFDFGGVSLLNELGTWDRYLFTIFLLRGLGQAVFAGLPETTRSHLDLLHQAFYHKKALFGIDFGGMSAKERIASQDDDMGFFAENFMHYLALGRTGMVGTGENRPLRLKLYDFYAALLPPFNPLLEAPAKP